jgi:ankyrin repeat protein
MALFLRSGTDFKEGQWLEASLHVAALAGAQSVIALLLDRGIDLEVQMFGKGTPLDVAASSGKVGAVCQLLRRGAVARLDGDDKGPLILELFMHAREDHLAEHFDDILKLLLQAGISLHVGNEHGNLVHHVLVKTPQLIDKLWEFKTPQPVDELKAPHVKDDFVNSYGDTPLWLALRLRYLDRILDLLCVEQNLYRKNSSGRALMGHMERLWGHTSLYYLPFLHRRGPMRRNPPIVHDTASLGLDAAWVINSLALLTDGGHARQHNRVTKETVSSLISRGANVNQRDRNRVTPLLDAMVTMDEEIVTLLLENGADPNVKDCAGDTALHIFAARWPANPTVLRLLLDKGARLDLYNKKGFPPYRRSRWDELEDPQTRSILEEATQGLNIADQVITIRSSRRQPQRLASHRTIRISYKADGYDGDRTLEESGSVM